MGGLGVGFFAGVAGLPVGGFLESSGLGAGLSLASPTCFLASPGFFASGFAPGLADGFAFCFF